MTDLFEYIKMTEEEEILLPDFQRNFVWTEIDQQKRLIASVLAGLPIGSLLLLEGQGNEFISKKIGKKKSSDTIAYKSYLYLLDGQQRLTVLINTFSNSIHIDITNNRTQLQHTSLLNRFFLKFTGLNKLKVENDLFGLTNFKMQIRKDSPSISSNEAYQVIETQVIKDETNPFYPRNHTNTAQSVNQYLNEFQKSADECWLPLFLLGNEKGNFLFNTLLNKISEIRQTYLLGRYNELNIDERNEFLSEYFEHMQNFESLRTEEEFSLQLNFLASEWVDQTKEYLRHVISRLKLEVISMPKSQRSRAIDIYESLNLGGVSLSTFDLIIAKAARVDNSGLFNSMVKQLETKIEIPECYNNTISTTDRTGVERDSKWSVNAYMPSVFNEDKYQFSTVFINVFLNLLSAKTHSIDINEDLTIDVIKRQSILNLEPEQVVNNYKAVIAGILRALIFLQMNCGIRKIDDVSYEHMLFGIAYFFIDEHTFKSSKANKIIEFWYWSSIFSGDYDSDQTSRIVFDVNLIKSILRPVNTESKIKHLEILKSRTSRILATSLFSDLDTLMLKNIEFDKYPKKSISNGILQYTLSKRPVDLHRAERLNTWDGFTLEAHHIIPLDTATSLFESTKELRDSKSSILNSPLNLTYISKEANNAIGGMAPYDYLRDVKEWQYSSHFIPEINEEESIYHSDYVVNFLENRFNNIKNNIQSHLDLLITNC